MTITSLIFLLWFLPITLAIYYLVDDKIKEIVLLGISIAFYAICSADFILQFIIVLLLIVAIGRAMNREENVIVRRILLIAGILLCIAVLGYYKYTNFGISIINGIIGSNFPIRDLAMPLGISFFTFKAISYLADIYTGKIELSENPIKDLLYLSFFGHIQAGPIARYNEMRCVWEEEAITKFECFSSGVFRFVLGFVKKVMVADILAKVVNEIFATDFSGYSALYAWLGAICFSLQLFVDFSGYSDMAVGLSRMFGYACMENFDYPYMTESVGGFWRRWHISLSNWFRDYVYIPLGGSRTDKKWKIYFNLLAVWVLTGIWHGAAWNFIIWGLLYFVAIAFERLTGIPKKINSKPLKMIYRLLTLLFINFEWVIFRYEGTFGGLQYIRRMLWCAPNKIADSRSLFLISEYWIFILCAVIMSVPVVPFIKKKCEKSSIGFKLYNIFSAVLLMMLFVFALSFVISGQNNPFAYANF